MKYSRIFASIASAALFMSMGTAVYADETTPAASGNTVTVNKTYTQKGLGESPAETFTLVQTGAEKTDGDYTGTIPALQMTSGAAYTAEDGATPDGNTKTFTITLPTAAEYGNVPGLYTYTLAEAVPAQQNAGVTYAPSTETVSINVMVAYNNDGVLEVTGGVANTSTTEGQTEKNDTINNTYSANELTISETVEGNGGDRGKEFSYTVTLTGDTSKVYQPINFAVESSSNGDSSAEASEPQTVTVNGDAYSFTLKQGETAVLTNIPAGVSYVVTEDDYSKDGYTTTIDKTETNTAKGEISADALSNVAFVNTKGITLNTGIFTDNMPLIVLGIALAAAAVLFMKKSNSIED
ncbi:MAG: hypothetical protein HUJ54_13270 [Erysipelotrichaceae bacterium]|nr:hypothetical protein [Erysipelotrichaceae bacterium]